MSNPQGNRVWVQLRVGETNIGDPFEVDGSGNVSNLKDAVKAEFPNALKHVDAPELKVYAPSGSSSSSDPDALRASTSIADCVIANASDDNPFIVQAHRGALVAEALPPAQQGEYNCPHKMSFELFILFVLSFVVLRCSPHLLLPVRSLGCTKQSVLLTTRMKRNPKEARNAKFKEYKTLT
jgi:hypothetical protein